MAFAFTFYILFNEADELRDRPHGFERWSSPEYDTVFKSLVSTYTMGVLGDFELENFWDFHLNKRNQDKLTGSGEVAMIALFIFLTAFVQIVLLNMLVRSCYYGIAIVRLRYRVDQPMLCVLV